MKPKKPTVTQLAILRNVIAGRRFDHGREHSRAASAGWNGSDWSCRQHGWLVWSDGNHVVTEAGRAIVDANGGPD